MDDISPDILVSLVSGELSADDARELRARAQVDHTLAEHLAAFESLAAFLRDESTGEISASAIRSAKQLLSASRPGIVERLADAAADGVRTFLAALDFDSRLTPAVAGYRGVADVTQVAFSCDACQIDLEIQPADGDLTSVRAQIDADDSGSWSISFMDRLGVVAATTMSDIDGAFRAELPDGSFTMVLERDGLRVEAGPLNIP